MRATLDRLISWGGLLLVVVLLVAGGLLTWANSFVGGQVHDQLAAQHITMPTAKTGLSALPAADRAALSKYAGQPMTKGPQAEAYANHFILVHMNEAAGGKAYADVSGEYQAQCATPAAAASAACQTLSGQKATLFQGDTLRGLLLYGYAFATIGTIAGYAAIGAFVAALIMLLLVGLGFRHSRNSGSAVAAGDGRKVAHAGV